MDQKIQLMQQAIINNTSSATSGSRKYQPYIGKDSITLKDHNKHLLFHVWPNWTFQDLMVMIPLAGCIKSSNIFQKVNLVSFNLEREEI